VVSVCSDGKGLTCFARDFFMRASQFYPQLDVVNYRIDLQIYHVCFRHLKTMTTEFYVFIVSLFVFKPTFFFFFFLYCFKSMDPLMENASSGSTYSAATSSIQHICFCEWLMMVKTTHTKENFGRRFVGCKNWKVNTLLHIFLFLYFCVECNSSCLFVFNSYVGLCFSITVTDVYW